MARRRDRRTRRGRGKGRDVWPVSTARTRHGGAAGGRRCGAGAQRAGVTVRGRRARTTRRRRAALGRELGGVASAECDDELGTGDRGGPAESDLRRSGGSSAPAARPKRRKFGSGGATAEGLDPTEEVRLRRRGNLRRDPSGASCALSARRPAARPCRARRRRGTGRRRRACGVCGSGGDG